jgi:hypothetical protein
MSQEKIKLEAVISMTEKIEWVKLKQLEINKIERDKNKIEKDKNEIENIDKKRNMETKIANMETKITNKKEEKKRLVYELLSEVRYRYTQIQKPFLTDKKNWHTSWNTFYDRIQYAYTDSFETYKESIDDAWEKILKYSKIPTIK